MFDQLDPTPSTADPPKPTAGKLVKITLTALCFLVPLAIFLYLANAIRGNDPLPGDIAILEAIRTIASPAVDKIMIAITLLGDAEIVIPLIAICGALLFFKFKKRKQAVFLALATGGTAAINVVFKHVFERQRPTLWEHLVTETSFSFPSGHAMISSAIAYTVIILCWHTKYRWVAIAGGMTYMLLVSFSRLYLGVHFPTDILAGWCVSALWVATVYLVFRQFGLLPQKAKPTPVAS